MTAAIAGSLAALALIDSTSMGTLVIPIWLLLASSRVRIGSMAIYLGTIAVFYFVVGLVLMLGANLFLPQLQSALNTPAALVVQFIAGVALFIVSFPMEKRAKERSARGESGRLTRWRERAMSDSSGAGRALAGLAIAAAVIELAGMLPYLAAIGMIANADLGVPASSLALAGYCLIMIAPAVVLVVVRLLARRAVEPVLQRLNTWISQHAAAGTSWIVGIVGFFLAAAALNRLGGVSGLLANLPT